jgi:hypothetical protein
MEPILWVQPDEVWQDRQEPGKMEVCPQPPRPCEPRPEAARVPGGARHEESAKVVT